MCFEGWILLSGVGIVLITVSGIAWRLTSTYAPSCGAMLGIGGGGSSAYDDDYNGRFLARPSGMTAAMNYGRPQHPYAGKINCGRLRHEDRVTSDKS